MLRNRIQYLLARLLLVYVAIHILDVSIDIDYLRQGIAHLDTDGYDDIDSFSELIIEAIAGDNNYVAEGSTDDSGPLHADVHKFAPDFSFASDHFQYNLTPVHTIIDSQPVVVHGVNFTDEDHSLLVGPPPKRISLVA